MPLQLARLGRRRRSDLVVALIYSVTALGVGAGGMPTCPISDLNSDGVIDTADPGVLLSAFGTMEPDADIDGDGDVDTADLGILLGEFGDPCPCTADINGDGVVDTADLGILLGVLGENCDGCIEGATGAPESLMAGLGSAQPTPLLNELGFTSVSSYIAWLDSLTPELLLQHLEECAELIQLAE